MLELEQFLSPRPLNCIYNTQQGPHIKIRHNVDDDDDEGSNCVG